jgi:hypothetical protein
MVIVLMFVLAGFPPETLAVVRDKQTCKAIAGAVQPNLKDGKVVCVETKVSDA